MDYLPANIPDAHDPQKVRFDTARARVNLLNDETHEHTKHI